MWMIVTASLIDLANANQDSYCGCDIDRLIVGELLSQKCGFKP
jgi:hypothetical protein